MEIGKKTWRIINNSGYEEPVYEKFRLEIIAQNNRLARTTSFIGSMIMIFLTVISIFMSSVSKVLPLYAVTAILFSVIYFVVGKLDDKNGTASLLCNYAFLTAAFFFAMGLDIIQKNATATTVCVLLVALPLLIVDRPWRELIFFLIVSICFMFESMYIKQSPKASIDVLNAFSFFTIGSFLGYKHNQMMLRNISNHSVLEEQRDIDPLTKLYNKGALERKATEVLIKENITASIIIIDMDNFKHVNDTYGHHAGDEILAKIGELLLSLFRNDDLLSRFGGDEFVVFLPKMTDKVTLEKRARQILKGVEDIRISADEEYRAHICMGISMYPKDGVNYEEIFKNADTAMYMVKQNGKNGFGFYGIALKPSILVVDDIEMNRAILKKTLEEEYTMFEAEDGREALEILKNQEDIVMVITDIQMPNMDGIELIKCIHADKHLKDIAIIANTQYGDPKQEEQIFKLGVEDFVYKAASPHAIQMRVRNVLKAKSER